MLIAKKPGKNSAMNYIGYEVTIQRTCHAGKTEMKYISARKADNKVMNNVSQEERNNKINVNGGKAKTKYFAKCSSKGQMRTC